mgnify:CR=1 FL=1
MERMEGVSFVNAWFTSSTVPIVSIVLQRSHIVQVEEMRDVMSEEFRAKEEAVQVRQGFIH